MGSGLTLDQSPAWRVAVFLMGFIWVSFFLETFFHKLEHYLRHKGLHGIYHAVLKIKEELMLLGFISRAVTREAMLAAAAKQGFNSVAFVPPEREEDTRADLGVYVFRLVGDG